MSTAARYTPHYTVADYRRWEGDWELWHGIAVAMTPSPFGRHGGMLGKIITALNVGIDQTNCNASVLVEVDWIIADDTVVRPDASIVCGDPPEGHIESAPALIAEVLSESTRERDLNHKRTLYQENGVRWYLIADPSDSSVQLFRLGDELEYESTPIRQVVDVSICDSCRLQIDLSWLSR